MRDFIAAASLGCITKLYDDLTDTSVIKDGNLKESLFTMLCLLLGAVSYNDFTFSSILYSLNIAAFLGGPESYESPKERSLLYAYPIMILLSLFSVSSLSHIEILLFLAAIVLIVAEAIVIKEDVSVRKLVIRSVLSVFIAVAILSGLTFLPISKSSLKFMFFGLAYMLVSVIFQIYSLFIKNSNFYQKWFAPVNSVDTDQQEKTEISSENTEKEKVLDLPQEQV
jgi:hypothetical protein